MVSRSGASAASSRASGASTVLADLLAIADPARQCRLPKRDNRKPCSLLAARSCSVGNPPLCRLSAVWPLINGPHLPLRRHRLFCCPKSYAAAAPMSLRGNPLQSLARHPPCPASGEVAAAALGYGSNPCAQSRHPPRGAQTRRVSTPVATAPPARPWRTHSQSGGA